MSGAPPDDPDRVLLDAARALTTVSLHAAGRLGGVSLLQLRALTVLAGSEPITLTELAARLRTTPSTAGRLVDRLVAAGLVGRRPSPGSRRSLDLRLTAQGRTTVEDYDRLRVHALRAGLTPLSDERRRQVLGCLPLLAGALGAAEERPPGQR